MSNSADETHALSAWGIDRDDSDGQAQGWQAVRRQKSWSPPRVSQKIAWRASTVDTAAACTEVSYWIEPLPQK